MSDTPEFLQAFAASPGGLDPQPDGEAQMRLISQKEALSHDPPLVRYFTGKPCKRGHVAERYTGNTSCIACVAERRGGWKRKRKRYHAKKLKAFAGIPMTAGIAVVAEAPEAAEIPKTAQAPELVRAFEALDAANAVLIEKSNGVLRSTMAAAALAVVADEAKRLVVSLTDQSSTSLFTPSDC